MIQRYTHKFLVLLAFNLSFTIVKANEELWADTIKTVKNGREEWVIRGKNEFILEIIRLNGGVKDGIQEKYHSNGKKSEESKFTQGFLNGTKLSYNVNGDLTSKVNYKYVATKKRSLPNGEFETYTNNTLVAKGTYIDSLIDGKYVEYHTDGKIKISATYKSGLLTGIFKQYRPSGEIYSEMNYSIINEGGNTRSVLNGSCKYYQQIGKLTEEGFYLNGKKEGVWKSYNEGKLYKSATYKNDLQHGEIIEYKNDQLKKRYTYYQEYNNDGVILKNIMDGRLEEYYDNGNLMKIENYKKGKRHGVFEEFYDNKINNNKSRTEYQEGVITGKQINWDVKGNKSYEVNYKISILDGVEKNIKHGKELRWENGVLTYEMDYENGVEVGLSKSYFPNGKLMKVAEISNGRYNGRCLEYYENGKLKSDQTYKTFTDKSGNLKSIQLGWRIEYDMEGKCLTRIYYDTLGEISFSMNYFKGQPISVNYKDLLILNYFPDGKLMSMEMSFANYTGSFTLNFYWNGHTRKMKIQNPDLDIINHIDFADNGEPRYSYSDAYHNPEEKRLDEKQMKKYAKAIDENIISNALFSDSIKNGNYKLYYAGGKLMAELNFTNDFPNGKFIYYDPVGTDTLSYTEYNKGVKVGYFVQKFGGETLYKRGRLYNNGQLAYNEYYQVNGLPYSKSSFDETGKRISNTEYFVNGKIKYSNNEITGDYAAYDENGNLQNEARLMDNKRKIKRHSEYYPGTSQLKSLYFTFNGVRDSLWENYFKDGQLQFRYAYKNGKKNGPSETYNEKGELLSKGNFIDDRQDGIFEIRKDGKMETVFYENGNLKVLPSTVPCVCQDTKESLSGTTFAPQVTSLISYNRLKLFLPNTIVPEDSISFSKIFYTGLQNSSSRDAGFYSMNLMMFQPHYFKIPADEQIKIVLNPCHTTGYRSRLETRANVSFRDDMESYISFYPERISLEFLKSPIKDVTDKSLPFRAYFDTKEVSIEMNKKLKIEYETDTKACHSPGIIYNFLKIQVSESQPILFKNPKEVSGLSISDLTLSEDDLKSFFGLWVKKAECSFPMIINSKEYTIQANSNLMLAGGTYVAGELHIPCSIDGKEISVKTDKEKVKITTDDLKSLWLDKGFTKLSVTLDKNKSELIIKFYAD